MPTPELQLISRVVRVGRPALTACIEWGISSDDYLTLEGRGMWNHINGHYRSAEAHGSVIGVNAAKLIYPNFELCDDASMTTEGLCAEVRKTRLIIDMKKMAAEIVEAVELDPLQTATEAHTALSRLIELGMSRKTDVRFSQALAEIKQDYLLMESGVDMSKGSWPWPVLQNATGGVQEDDFIVLYGRPKSMKTWVLSAIIAHFFLMDRVTLIYTKEMTPKNIYKRIAGCIAGIPYRELRSGKLIPSDRALFEELVKYVEMLESQDSIICLSGRDVASGGDTVSWLRSKAEKYKPDAIFIDGMYLLSDASSKKSTADWQRVTNISREVSAMRLELRTPTIVTMQANRKASMHEKAELDEVAYADAVGQDATIAIRVINEKSKPTIALVLGGSREFQLHGLRIGGIPATDFTEKEEMSEKEIVKAKEEDTKKEEESTPGKHSRARRVPKTTPMNGVINELMEQQLKDM